MGELAGIMTEPANIDLTEEFLLSMRSVAASVSLVTACDAAGKRYGMAVTSAVSLSVDPPSILVAVNKSASIHPVISKSGFFTVNLMSESHCDLLEAFSRSDLRDRRFLDEHWIEGAHHLPVLIGALSTHICSVAAAHDFGTHTVFFGQVEEVILPEGSPQPPAPIVWLNGSRVSAVASGQQ